MLADGIVEGVLILPSAGIVPGDSTAEVEMLVDNSRELSAGIERGMEHRFKRIGRAMSREMLSEINAPENVLDPFKWSISNVASSEKMGGMILGSFLPYMMILFTLMGGMYAAMDVTAGEKERSTLETLLVSPVSRFEVAAGKFLTVMTISLATALISLLSIAFWAAYGLTMLAGPEVLDQLNFTLDPTKILLAALLLLPLAAFFASVQMTISIFARTVREAQTYLSPLMMVVIIPAMMSMLPGTESSASIIWIPVVNVSLLTKEILTGSVEMQNLLITFLSSSIYALIGIVITMKVFEREQVLFRV